MTDRVRMAKNMIEGGYITYDQIKDMTDNGKLSVLELSVLQISVARKLPYL